jgi:hypothetical protein
MMGLPEAYEHTARLGIGQQYPYQGIQDRMGK